MTKNFIEHYASLIKTPYQMQSFLHALKYNAEENGETLRSANEAFKAETAHCLEACFMAAAVLEKHNYPPLALSLESVDCLDHVVYLFQYKKKWGAVGHSRDYGLHGRKAVFKTPRDVAESFIDAYVDSTGRIKAYAVIDLNECKSDWRNSTEFVWEVEQYISDYPHKPLNCSESHYKKLYKRFIDGFKPLKKSYWL
ncbi:MAG: hypothetical protein R3A80_10920 [Bdellovibrionota bacterium]